MTDRAGTAVPDGVNAFPGVVHHWDSSYYLAIADGGYVGPDAFAGLPSFFPGYPLAARAVAAIMTWGQVTTDSLVPAMALVSSISSLIAAMLVWRIAQLSARPRVAPLATLMFVAGPYSIFLYADYSEALFLAFATAAWYCGLRDRWWLAGVWCALASFTRINGLFLLAGLVVMYLVQRRRNGRPLFSVRLGWVAVGALGISAYFGYLLAVTGDPLAWRTAQAIGWNRQFHPPWDAVYQTAGRVLFASTPDRRLQFALDLVFALLLVWAIWIWFRRRDWASATYGTATIVPLTTSFTLVSIARNTVTVFPLAILLAERLRSTRRRWLRTLALSAWFGLFLVNATLFTLGYWTD